MQPDEAESQGIVAPIARALRRARTAILAVALVYLASLGVGILMVHTGNEYAIASRDRIVARAQSSPITLSLKEDNRLRAAVLDFGGNLYAAIATTLGGLGVIAPFPVLAYRGWIGGIVSIDSTHASRLADPAEARYYLVTLTLQIIPYVLAVGAGVNMGLAFVRPKTWYQGEKWLGIPKEAIRDALRIYLLVVPLFFVASLWEFLER